MLIMNATLASGEKVNILAENGVITQIYAADGNDKNSEATLKSAHEKSGNEVINASGLTILPAFIDLHCHFRTPGFEYKEDIETGSRAAAAGGFVHVTCMANTNPVCSSEDIAESVMRKAQEVGLCDVNQCVSITENFDGKTLSHLHSLSKSIKFISDDGKGVQSNETMWKAMLIAKEKGLTVLSHAEDMDISGEDYRLAENIETARNLHLAHYTGAKLHMCHVSTKEALADIISAKENGADVTCEVSPHHIWFYGLNYKVNPPIREKQDVDFIINAIKNGKVDAIATDHAPHTAEEKAKGTPGLVGLETAFSVCYTKLCLENGLELQNLSKMMSENPAKILGINKGKIEKGYDADFALVDLSEKYTVNASEFKSKSKNTPFDGVNLQGRVKMTIKAGKCTYN